jgi:hypothetical protein
MPVREINPADRDRGADPHQVRPRQQAALSHGPEIVDFHFDRGETARAGKMVLERASDRRVGKARGDTAVHRSGGIQEFGAHAALDGETVAMDANQLETEQVIECVIGEERSYERGLFLLVAQVW